MKKKITFKIAVMLMIVSALPFSNFNIIIQKHQLVREGKASAATTSPVSTTGSIKPNNGEMERKTNVSAFSSISSPAAFDNTYNWGLSGSAANPIVNSSRPAIGTGSYAQNDGGAVPNPATVAPDSSQFGYQNSIAGITDVATGKVVVISGNNSVYTASSVSDTTVQAALNYIATNGSASTDYVLFIGGNVTLSATSVGKTGILVGLSGKAKSLTIVSNVSDSLSSSNTSAASGNSTITMPSAVYLGVPTVFRNTTVAATADTIYTNGNAFATTSGSSVTGGPTIYGGNDGSSSLTGDTNIFLGAYGTGTWNIYGGSNGGTISGNTHVTINGFNGASINNLSGGSNTGGTINGDTNLTVKNMAGAISNVFGAGMGTSSNPNTVTGNSYNTLVSNTSSTSYDDFWGGLQYGNAATEKNSSIYNNISGSGSIAAGWSQWSGGNQGGNVGNTSNSAGTGNAIYNNFDVSLFSTNTTGTNSPAIAGGNAAAVATAASGTAKGFVYGDIVTYARAGFSNGTKFYGIIGGNGYGMAKSTLSNGTTNNTPPYSSGAAVDTAAQSNSTSGHIGNSYTWGKGGNLEAANGNNGLNSFLLAGSSSGYDQGNVSFELGTTPGASIGGNGEVATISSLGAKAVGGTGMAYGNLYNNNTSMTATSTTTSGSATSLDPMKDTAGGTVNDTNGMEIGAGGMWGLNADRSGSYVLTGNANIVVNNALLGYSYAGAYNGYVNGNVRYIMNLGIANTLQASRIPAAVFGDSELIINFGCVESFLGGSWGTNYWNGNATTKIYDGKFNASVGGSYNSPDGGNALLTGNSELDVYGGDFSLATSLNGGEGYNGNARAMTISGNSTLEMNLAGPNGKNFLPPSKAIIGASNTNNLRSYTGSGQSNSIDLAVVLPNNPSPTVAAALANNTFYGDSNYASNYTNVGSINIYVTIADATSTSTSVLGSVYAAAYQNYDSSNNIVNATDITIGSGIDVKGDVSGSTGSLTNSMYNSGVSKSGKDISVTLGDMGNNSPVKIEGNLTNFGSLTVGDNESVSVTGKLLNGANATANNHAASYSGFGNFTLGDKASLGIISTTSIISGGKLEVDGDVTLTSPYTNTVGLMNFSDLNESSASSNITWNPLGDVTSPTTTYSGAYWGSQKGFPVLTFNGGTGGSYASGASIITPGNFQGIDANKNYSFLGDYTYTSQSTPTSPSWVAYVVPGQTRVFNTTDATNGVLGNWVHNLTNITTGTPVAGQVMSAWSDTSPGVGSNSIRVMYTMAYANSVKPAFNFTSAPGSYVQRRVASAFNGTVLNNYSSYSPDFSVNPDGTITGGAVKNIETNDYFTGNQLDGTNDQANFGSYIIESVVTSNQSVLKVANNSIVNNTKAEGLTASQLEGLLGLSGTGVVSDLQLSSPTLATINSGIGSSNEGIYNSIPVKFTMGSTSATGNLVIVPDHAKISSDGQSAIDVYDATLSGDEAHALKTDVNSITPNESAQPPIFADGLNYYTGLGNAGNKPLAIKSDGTVSTPVLSNKDTLITELQNISNTGTLTANYAFNGLTMDAVLTINVGYLEFTSAPADVNWGKLSVSPNNLVAYPSYSGDVSGATGTGEIVVTDTRTGSQASPWTMAVAVSTPLAQNDGNGNNSLANYLMFNDGITKVNLNSSNTVIHNETSSASGVYNLNQNWGSASGQGLYLDVPAIGQHIGTYQGKLTWTLSSVPSNS